MFTGIIEEIGKIKNIRHGSQSARLEISCKKVLEDIHIGDSIATNGMCLTVTDFSASSFRCDIMHESLNRTSLQSLQAGSAVNLERAMPLNGRFGGHIVTGHVDGLGRIQSMEKDDNAIWFHIQTSDEILRYVVEKGSIAIDGISLTVAGVGPQSFSVSIIPHTIKETCLQYKKEGDSLNLETDILGKYVEKLLDLSQQKPDSKKSHIDRNFLARHGF